MDTYFAPAGKASPEEMAVQIGILSNNPVMTGLLQSVSGLLAVLNDQRQIVTVNHSLLSLLNVDNAEQILGLRPGEALHCEHADEEPAGCGTTRFCSTCGAAMAIVSCLGEDKPVERICALSTRRGEKHVDLALLVRCQAVTINEQKFLLLFLQDITLQQQRAALERTFFHDISNMLCGLEGLSNKIRNTSSNQLANNLHQAVIRLKKEIAIQRCLSLSESGSYSPLFHEVGPQQIFTDLKNFFATHPAAQNKRIQFQEIPPEIKVTTDISLLSRILCNMLLNALEASTDADVVKIWSETTENHLCFCVWNRETIPSEVRTRIFQRNFTTKNQAGRGIGTFSMKLFGENVLGGKVSYQSSEQHGTIFRFCLPLPRTAS